MKIAVISDIHGNYQALKRCLEDAISQGVDAYIWLGDYLGEFPYPQNTMKTLHDMQTKERILDYITGQLNISEVVGRYAKENPSSGNVMKKLGFIYEKDIPYECNEGKITREGIQCRLVL